MRLFKKKSKKSNWKILLPLQINPKIHKVGKPPPMHFAYFIRKKSALSPSHIIFWGPSRETQSPAAQPELFLVNMTFSETENDNYQHTHSPRLIKKASLQLHLDLIERENEFYSVE